MSTRRCIKCGMVWPGENIPFCPSCMTYDWENADGFIKPKHDPRCLPLALPDKRSVVTMDFITDKSLYISTVAKTGDYYYDTVHKNFTCILYEPLGVTAGSAVPPHFPLPTYPLNSQMVVDIFNNPHVYAEDSMVINLSIASGRLIPANNCDVPGCTNLAIPGTTKCQMH